MDLLKGCLVYYVYGINHSNEKDELVKKVPFIPILRKDSKINPRESIEIKSISKEIFQSDNDTNNFKLER